MGADGGGALTECGGEGELGDVLAAFDQDEDAYAASGGAGGGLGDQCVAAVVGGNRVDGVEQA